MLGFHFGGAVAQRDLDAAPVGHANEADREMARARRFIDGPAIVSDLASVIFGKADEELQEIALFKKGDHFQRQTERTCRSEEHTSELQSLMRISYDVFCLKKK